MCYQKSYKTDFKGRGVKAEGLAEKLDGNNLTGVVPWGLEKKKIWFRGNDLEFIKI